MSGPTAEFFIKGHGNWAVDFLAEMYLNEPRILPPNRQNLGSAAVLRNAGRTSGKTIAIRTFEGALWACWIEAAK